jgi:probable phosphoglycerate mutase
MMPPTIYLIRHATPDWSRTDLPYHVPPGPPLTPQGEREAEQLGLYLREAGVAEIYASPLERCRRTAQIAAGLAGVSMQNEDGLAEWRPEEKSDDIHLRFRPVWEQARDASLESGAVALVTHGGPIALMLAELGLIPEALSHYKKLFDRSNPLPPAGAWKAVQNGSGWQLSLSFAPESYRPKLFV